MGVCVCVAVVWYVLWCVCAHTHIYTCMIRRAHIEIISSKKRKKKDEAGKPDVSMLGCKYSKLS